MTLAVGLILLGAVLLYAGLKGESVRALLVGNVQASSTPQGGRA